MNTKEIQNMYQDYLLPTYTQLPVCLVKGKGSRVWDIENREYLDFFPGWAVSGLGHCHPAVINAIKEQSKKIIHIPNNFLNLKQAKLAEALSEASFPARMFFSNSGAEANEAAIKFARKYGSATGRFEIITMKRSFHGRTLATLTATGQDKVQKGFEPLPAGFKYAEFNDLESVKNLVNEKTVAVMLELVLGEGGIEVATRDFAEGLRKLCDEKDMLLIIDEVQTCMGRTGKMFAYQNYAIEPDLMTLAKSLGNGVPIGALVANKKIKGEVMTAGSHGSTYGGNPLVAAAALAVIETIKKEKLLSHASEIGDYLNKGLLNLKDKYQVIREVRGLGVMRGVVLDCPGADVVQAALKRGLLINCTQEKVLRIMPAINVTKKEIDKALEILDASFEEAFEKIKS